MTYHLPSVNEIINFRIDSLFESNETVVEELNLDHNLENPAFFLPIDKVPSEVRNYTKNALGSTYVKLKLQAHIDSCLLPIIDSDTLDLFNRNIQNHEREAPLEASVRYVDSNKFLFISVVAYSQEVKLALRTHIQYPVLYGLMLLEYQGRKDKLNIMSN